MIGGGAVAFLAFGAVGVINLAGVPVVNRVAGGTLARIVTCRRVINVAIVAIVQVGVAERNAMPAIGGVAVGTRLGVVIGFAVAIGALGQAGVTGDELPAHPGTALSEMPPRLLEPSPPFEPTSGKGVDTSPCDLDPGQRIGILDPLCDLFGRGDELFGPFAHRA